MKISEERFIRIICISLKVLAWFLLIFGMLSSVAMAAVLAPILLMSRWSGVVILLFFILVFLLINLVVKIAEILVKIKTKVEA